MRALIGSLLIIGGVTLTGGGTAFAAIGVNNVTASLSTTSASATEVDYTVGFTATTGLTTNSNGTQGTITITAPTGTSFSPNYGTYTLKDVTQGATCDDFYPLTLNGAGNQVTGGVYGCPSNFNAGDVIQVVAEGTSNPTSASSGDSISVSTSSDTTAVSSTPTYSIGAATSVSSVSVSVPNDVTATGVTYSAAFTLASGLVTNTNGTQGTITLTAPTGTSFSSSYNYYTLKDVTQDTTCGNFYPITLNGAGNQVTGGVYSCPSNFNAGDVIQVTAGDTTNPSSTSTSDHISVTTSSDTVAANSESYAIVAETAVTPTSISLSSDANGATGVTYSVGFTPSASGALANQVGSITLAAPSGTVFSGTYPDYVLHDVTQATSCYLYPLTTANSGATLTGNLYNCSNVAAGDELVLDAADTTNPSTNSTTDKISISTSSDLATAQTAAYSIVTPGTPPATSISLSSSAAGASEIDYLVGFTASGTVASSSGTVKLTAPTGTAFSSSTGDFTIDDVTQDSNCGVSGVSNGTATVTLTLGGCFTINSGDSVVVNAENTINPTTTSTTDQISINTSANSTTARTPDYSITTVKAVVSPSVTLSSTSAGASAITYTATFNVSSTGGLVLYHGTVTLAAAAGTQFSGSSSNYSVEDNNIPQNCGIYGNPTLSNNDATVTMTISCFAVAAGDTLVVTASDVTNSSTTSNSDSLTVTTSSDTASATAGYKITSPSSVTNPSFSLSTTAAGVTAVAYTASFTLTTGLADYNSSFTLSAAAGTTFSSNNSDYYIDDLTNGDDCYVNNIALTNTAATVTANIWGCANLYAGNHVVLTVASITNPTTTTTSGSPDTITFSTSSDNDPVSGQYQITAPNSVGATTLNLTSEAPGATNVTYTAGFQLSATGALVDASNASVEGTITLTAPSGTVLPSSYSNYTLKDVTQNVTCGDFYIPSAGGVILNGAGNEVTGGLYGCPHNFNAGDTIQVVIEGVANPTTASTGDVISISTSTDLVSANTPAYSIGGPSTTTLTNPSSSIFGKIVTYSSTVTSPGGTPTGTVAVINGSHTLCTMSLSAGAGSCSTRATPVGTDSLTANYSGDSNFVPSTDTSTITVSQAASSTAIAATPSGNPATYGQSVTYAATVTDATTSSTGTPTGTVTVSDGATPLCTIALSNGAGHCSASNAPAGSTTITADYPGDTNFKTSSGTTGLSLAQAASATDVMVTPVSSVDGQSVTFQVTVADSTSNSTGTPTGTFKVSTGATSLCTGTLASGSGTCTSSAAPIGTDPISAGYLGDSNFDASTGTTTLYVSKLNSSTSSVTAPSSWTFGQSESFSASVANATSGTTQTPTGTVTFYVGTTKLCTGTLNSGTASCSSLKAPGGSDTITADYSGDGNFNTSSGTTTATVAVATTSTAVTATPSNTPDVYGQSVTYAATVTDVSSGSTGTPNGTVTFKVATINLCTATLTAGSGSCASTRAPAGSVTVTGTYKATIDFGGSAGTTPLTVDDAATTTTPSVSPTTATSGESVSYSATVADATTGSTGTPAGSVKFTIGSTTICTARLSGGSGSCRATTAPIGTDTVNATYVPTTDFTGSSGSTTLTVT
jgi:hypothetical protein